MLAISSKLLCLINSSSHSFCVPERKAMNHLNSTCLQWICLWLNLQFNVSIPLLSTLFPQPLSLLLLFFFKLFIYLLFLPNSQNSRSLSGLPNSRSFFYCQFLFLMTCELNITLQLLPSQVRSLLVSSWVT